MIERAHDDEDFPQKSATFWPEHRRRVVRLHLWILAESCQSTHFSLANPFVSRVEVATFKRNRPSPMQRQLRGIDTSTASFQQESRIKQKVVQLYGDSKEPPSDNHTLWPAR